MIEHLPRTRYAVRPLGRLILTEIRVEKWGSKFLTGKIEILETLEFRAPKLGMSSQISKKSKKL